jgi:hypothetical protein
MPCAMADVVIDSQSKHGRCLKLGLWIMIRFEKDFFFKKYSHQRWVQDMFAVNGGIYG